MSGRRDARGSAPHRDPREVASKAAQKPRSTAAPGRSEGHTVTHTLCAALAQTTKPPRRPTSYVGRFPYMLDGVFKPIPHKNFAERPTGRPAARPGKFRFAYAESPAKQRRDRDVRGTAHNPSELGRICILLAGVCHVPRGLLSFVAMKRILFHSPCVV